MLEGAPQPADASTARSGKTPLMHINSLQYQHYLNLHGGRQMNRVILLTPNEGLSHQHLEEFHLSGIDAELSSKEGCVRVARGQPRTGR